MAKTWCGWTEKRWRETLEWKLTSHQFTFMSRCGFCYTWRRGLVHSGEWETFPKDLKWNIQLYAHIYEKTLYPKIKDEKRKGLEIRIEKMETELSAFKAELKLMKKET